MRTIVLLGLLSLAIASPAPAQYDVRFIAGVAVDVVSWNGQPALLMWGRQQQIMYFEGNAYSGPRVALDVQLAMFVDSRGCSVGARTGISPNTIWHVPHGIMPAGGVLFSTAPQELRDLHREMSVTRTHYGADYCPTMLGCDGCGSRQREGPEMWAIIATVQLW